MKKTTLILTAAIAATLLAGGTAVARTILPSMQAQPADVATEGRISRADFIERRVARLTAIDANRDGLVSSEERRSGHETRRNQRASSRFETLDKDNNGSLSRDEFMAHGEGRGGPDRRAARPDMGGDRPGPHRMAGRGEARGPVSIVDMQTRLAAQFDRLDTDRDGFVTVEERRAGRGDGRAKREGRRAGRPSPSAAASE